MHDVTISTAGWRVVKLLVGTEPKTISDLIDATGVTRTAITEQLHELIASGLVSRKTERLPGRGRPRHLYSATDASLRLLFASNQRVVFRAMWKAIEEAGGESLLRKICQRISQAMVDHYNRRILAQEPSRRLQEMTELLNEEGGLAEAIVHDGQLVMYKRSCPFISMVDENRCVCCVDLEVMTAVVGKRVRRTACRHEGAPCCAFEILSE